MGLNTVTQTVLVTTAVTVVTIFGTIIYKKWKRVIFPSSWEKVGTVKKLCLFPLKSGQRIETDQLEVTQSCVQQVRENDRLPVLRDRGLVVYGAKDHELRTARTYPKMVFIDVSVHDEEHLAVDAPTMRTLYVKIPKRGENNAVKIKFFQNEVVEGGIDCGDEAAEWFSRYIIERDSGLRLAYNDASIRRDITKAHQKLLNYYKNLGNLSTGLFSDLTSVSLVNAHSVKDLNKRIGGDSAIPAEQFRHNIVVDGPDMKAYDEDEWEWVKVGDEVVLRTVKDCTRCVMTTINPEKGVRNAQREPLRTLNTYRKSFGPENAPSFGLNLEVRQTGTIKVGDVVYVSKKAKKETKQ